MSALDDIKARYDRAAAELDRLTEGNPGTNWRWSIPANPERDSDLILADSLATVPKLLAALEAVEEVLKKLDAIQEYDNVSRNACAGGIANVIRDVIDEEME